MKRLRKEVFVCPPKAEFSPWRWKGSHCGKTQCEDEVLGVTHYRPKDKCGHHVSNGDGQGYQFCLPALLSLGKEYCCKSTQGSQE